MAEIICPRCGGSGMIGQLRCVECMGHGEKERNAGGFLVTFKTLIRPMGNGECDAESGYEVVALGENDANSVNVMQAIGIVAIEAQVHYRHLVREILTAINEAQK